MSFPCTRCGAPAVVVVYLPQGCSCSSDQYQALCAQHEMRTQDTAEVFVEVVRLHHPKGEPTIADLQRDYARAQHALAQRVLGDPRVCVSVETKFVPPPW